MLRLPLSHVRAGRYRTRKARAEAQRRQSKPQWGFDSCAVPRPLGMSTKKDAAAGAPFQPTPVRASNPNNNDQRQGIPMRVVSCLWCYISLFFHGRVWYTRLSSTNRCLSKRQIHNLISHFYVPVPKGRKHLIQVPKIFRVQKDYTQLVAEFPHNPCE